jgi:DNA-binding transcriptional regulator GbsR (MarR family)
VEFTQCRSKFIETWGELGAQWGIPKTMAQLHALLLISPEPLNAEQMTSTLEVSQGNANMNLRALMDWGLISKIQKPGERCDYYHAEKNINLVFKCILTHRKKKELEPLVHNLKNLTTCHCKSSEEGEYNKVVGDISEFVTKTNQALETILKTDSHWFFNTLMRIMK